MRTHILVAAFMATILAGGAAMAQDDREGLVVANSAGAVDDPIEPVNRAVHGFNDVVDNVLLKPVATIYRDAVPKFARQRVNNALNNLNEPVNALNSLLQGDVQHTFTSLWRFTLNSTLGIGGLFDFADENAGLKYRREDFGQTLGHWGAGPGAYLVLPIIGPSNVRDAFGLAVDIVSSPFTWIFDGAGNATRAGFTAIDTRHRMLDFTSDVEKNSLDPYSTYRSSYLQYRQKQIKDIRPGYRYSYDPKCH